MNVINYFNPVSSDFHAIRDFPSLTTAQKVATVALTALAAAATLPTLGLGGVAMFRYLVGRFSKKKYQICITSSRITSWLGEESENTSLPDYLKDMTCADGSPLPWDPKDFWVELKILNPSKTLSKQLPTENLNLPGALFKDKQDGDTLELRYKGELFQLTINQNNHVTKFQQGSFQQALQLTKECCDKYHDPGTVKFGKFDPYRPYRLNDKKVIYRLQNGENRQLKLIKTDQGNYREIDSPEIMRMNAFDSEDYIVLHFALPGFSPEDIDIVLNNRYLCVYGCFKNKSNLDIEGISEVESVGWSEEYLRMLKLNDSILKRKSYKEIKNSVENATVTLQAGILQIILPINCS